VNLESEILRELISEFNDRNQFLESLFENVEFFGEEKKSLKISKPKRNSFAKRLTKLDVQQPLSVQIPKVQPFQEVTPSKKKGQILKSPMKRHMTPYRENNTTPVSKTNNSKLSEKFSPMKSPTESGNFSELPTMLSDAMASLKENFVDLEEDFKGFSMVIL
jgi:hypothetical protein